ncbi:hypothetical protein PENTCL1PPCAC_6016, partial [Pristionchus entomophagus]
MISLLFLLAFFSPILPVCIDWTQCDKATCFSKYDKREALGLYSQTPPPAPTTPTIGLSLQNSIVKQKRVTTVVLQVPEAGMQDGDFAALVVGDKILAGCHKGANALQISSKYIQQTEKERKVDGGSFCCSVDVSHLNVEFVAASSALPLTVNYSSSNKPVSLPTDFSVSLVLHSLNYRKEVKCEISSFRMETETLGASPYYPLQDPEKGGRCGIENHAIRMVNGTKDLPETRVVPMCEEGKWTLNRNEVDFSKFPLRCVQRRKQMRRSCAGHAPPVETRCGKACGSMDQNFFLCLNHAELYMQDGSSDWAPSKQLRCTDRGYVSQHPKSQKWTLLSNDARVQCRVSGRIDPFISSVTFPRWIAVVVTSVIFCGLFAALTYGCRLLFFKWAARVKEIGPIRATTGLSGRTTGPNSFPRTQSNVIQDVSNRSLPS